MSNCSRRVDIDGASACRINTDKKLIQVHRLVN